MTKEEFMKIVFSNIFEIIAYVVTPIIILAYMPEIKINIIYYAVLAISTITILTCLESRSRRAINVMIPTAFLMFMFIWVISYEPINNKIDGEASIEAMSMAVYFVATISFCCLVMCMLAFCCLILLFMWALTCISQKRLIPYKELQTLGTDKEKKHDPSL